MNMFVKNKKHCHDPHMCRGRCEAAKRKHHSEPLQYMLIGRISPDRSQGFTTFVKFTSKR